VTDTKTIRNKIIDILKAYSALSAVKSWLIGEPPRAKYPSFPFGWVEWNRGPLSAPIGLSQIYEDEFFVVIVDRHPDADKAENNVETFVSKIEDALAADPSINGLVAASYVKLREKTKVFEADASLAAVRLTLWSRRKE